MKKPILLLLILCFAILAKAQDPTNDSMSKAAQASTAHAKLDTTPIYLSVEHQPSYPGGAYSFNDYMAKSLNALHNTYTGIIIIQFAVERDGSLSKFKIIRGSDETANTMAVTILKNSPKWNPAIQNGKIVRCYFTVPIKFEGE